MNIYTLHNDIALIKMKSHHRHAIIRLAASEPPVSWSANATDESSRHCKIYGYGRMSDGQHEASFPHRLHYAPVELISFERCALILGRVTAPIAGSGQFCAVGRERGADAHSGEAKFTIILHFNLLSVTEHKQARFPISLTFMTSSQETAVQASFVPRIEVRSWLVNFTIHAEFLKFSLTKFFCRHRELRRRRISCRRLHQCCLSQKLD